MGRHLLTALACLIVTASVWAQESEFSLTIYSAADPANPRVAERAREPDGYAVVREIRTLNLPAGVSTVRFADVAASIDPTTVSFRSLTSPDTRVLEQSFEYDAADADRLLQKYVGKDILINRKPLGADGGRLPDSKEGKLLAFDDRVLVIETRNKQMPTEIVARGAEVLEIKLFNLETPLVTRPTLVWKVDAKKAGEHKAQVSYQTRGITWRADYRLLLNKDSGDLSAWASIINASGAAYPNARLKLVAGDLGRVRQITLGWLDNGGAMDKAFFEYHMYTPEGRTSLTNNATKQLELFTPRPDIKLTKSLVCRYAGEPQRGEAPDTRAGPAEQKLAVDVRVHAINDEKSGLGLALPAGRVRVYQTDEADDQAEFVGEDVIGHTPVGQPLSIRVGSATDITVQRRQTAFEAKAADHTITETIELVVRNARKEPAKLTMEESLWRGGKGQVAECSEKHTQPDAQTIQIPIEIPAGGEKTVTYRVKYAW